MEYSIKKYDLSENTTMMSVSEDKSEIMLDIFICYGEIAAVKELTINGRPIESYKDCFFSTYYVKSLGEYSDTTWVKLKLTAQNYLGGGIPLVAVKVIKVN